jgi:putative chitinase
MPLQIDGKAWRALLPRAPQAVIDAFLAHPAALDAAGITQTRTRFAYWLANIEHECGGFTIKNLTENINYTPERMAEVWPTRYSSAAAVRAKFGSAAGWQSFAMDVIYGGRMGNRPGTRDGSTYIGRGGPQWTGRDGYSACAKLTGLPAVEKPESIAAFEVQPEVCAAFWTWKGLNRFADVGDFVGGVKVWNGGTNGMADRKLLLAGNDPIVAKLAFVTAVMPAIKELPGGPDTAAPPKDVLDDATKKERAARAAAGAVATAGVGNEVAKNTTPVSAPLLSSHLAYGAIGITVVVAIVSTVLIARKQAAVIKNWF